jgi:NDP-sugar pyrophosphorylase family protein
MKSKCITSPKANKSVKTQFSDLVTVILLCDSPGYRMKSYGPLPLISIANQKLIDLQIQAIQQSFINFEIILCVGFDTEKICKYIRTKHSKVNIRVVENQLFNSSNSCESVRIALNNTLNHRVLVCDGNLLLNYESLALINCLQTCVLIETNPCDNLEIGINIDEKEEAQYFSFGACKTWSEIIYLHNQEVVELFRKAVTISDNKNRFIFEALNDILKSKYKIKCIKNEHQLRKISNIKTYHALKDKI